MTTAATLRPGSTSTSTSSSTSSPATLASGLSRIVRVADTTLGALARALGRAEVLVTEVHRDSARVAEDVQALLVAARPRARALLRAGRSAPRLTRILSEAARLIVGYRLLIARSEHLAPAERVTRRGRWHAQAAARVRELCLELGGGVLKVGQFASSRPDLLPPEWVAALSALQDRAHPEPWEAIEALLVEELGQPVEVVFADLDPTPIAAASLAQVHRARLAEGGAVVALKVQRPGVGALLDIDLGALEIIAGWLSDMIPLAGMTDLTTIAAELSRSVREELDFRDEARRLAEFGRWFADDERVVVPQPIEPLCSERLLVMTHVDGARLPDYLDGASPEARDGLLQTLLDVTLRQVLTLPAYQADPHPGNFLVTADGALALLDFGNVQAQSAAARRALAEVAGACLARDTARVAELLTTLGFETRDGDPSVLVDFADLILGLFYEAAGAEGLAAADPHAMMNAALALARDNPVLGVPPAFVSLGRVFGSLSGLLLAHKPRLNLFALLVPHLQAALAPPSPLPRLDDAGAPAPTADRSSAVMST